jgi:hypothetical protein
VCACRPPPQLGAIDYLKHGQYLVKGWLFPGAPEAIILLSEDQTRAGVFGGIAEIGVHHGKLFILLYLLSADNEPAVAIDLFSRQELNVDRSGAGDLERFKRNLRLHADTSRLVIHEGDSTQLTSESLIGLGRGSFRLISIDGGHTASITASDLAIGEGAIGRGGIIILDDCFNQEWPGVMDGIYQHFSHPRTIVPFGIGANKTFFCHPEFAARYSGILRGLDSKAIEQEFLGQPVVCFRYAPWSLTRWYRKVDPWRAVRNTYHFALLRMIQSLCRLG